MTSPWARAAHAYGVVVALSLAYFVARSPLQIGDALGNMLSVQGAGFWDLVGSQFESRAFLRPFLWAQLDLTFELANGRYHEMYKAMHALQLVAAAVLFVNLLKVRTMPAAAGAIFGLAALFGSHVFAGTMVEGFPINTYLTIVLCCLAAANLSFGRPGVWRDAAAVALFVFAALTVESGLLVWVVLAAAWLAGGRGVSTRGLAAATAALAAYFVVRFVAFDVGVPSLVERSSGFGFRVLDPPELIALFGDWPWVFYAYNVASQFLTVLFAEPKNGVWLLTRQYTSGELLPREVIGVLSATGATALIAWYAASRLPDWRRRTFEHGDRLLLVFAAVLLANAAISYPYTKDVIVSPAGVFHAAVAAVAFAHAVSRIDSLRRGALVATVALTLLSAGWAVRLVGIHYQLREKAYIVRNDWIRLGPAPNGWNLEENPEGRALVRQLYDEAVGMRIAGPAFHHPEAWKYFEQAW